jgi:hypothetical protein
MINAFWQDLYFQIQEEEVGDWMRIADTSMPSPYDLLETGEETALGSLNYGIKARSILVLLKAA